MEEKFSNGLQYLISYPKDFDESKKYPLVLFLHGAGTRAETTDNLRKNICLINIVNRQDERGYITLAPLCTSDADWFELMQPLINLVEATINLPYIDKTRVHVTGNSMGGYGTWEIAIRRPDWFASAMPLCGGGIGGFAKYLVDVPIRTFHGLCDQVVDPIESIQMAKAVNLAGGYV